MTDKEILLYLLHYVDLIRESFSRPNDEDKFHALENMIHIAERIKSAILARIEISYKSYPPPSKPWLLKSSK